MSEHEQHETEEIDDLEPTAEDTEQVTGGAVKFGEIVITKPIDKPSP
jgi:type VI protein secretion system component Hcp